MKHDRYSIHQDFLPKDDLKKAKTLARMTQLPVSTSQNTTINPLAHKPCSLESAEGFLSALTIHGKVAVALSYTYDGQLDGLAEDLKMLKTLILLIPDLLSGNYQKITEKGLWFEFYEGLGKFPFRDGDLELVYQICQNHF